MRPFDELGRDEQDDDSHNRREIEWPEHVNSTSEGIELWTTSVESSRLSMQASPLAADPIPP